MSWRDEHPEEKCGNCVYHIEDACQIARVFYGENWSKPTDDESVCEMFTRGVYEGVHTMAFTPGTTLAELMLDKGLYVKHMKDNKMAIDSDIAKVLNGSARVDEPTAEKLEAMFGTTSGFWLNMQKAFDENLDKVNKELRERS